MPNQGDRRSTRSRVGLAEIATDHGSNAKGSKCIRADHGTSKSLRRAVGTGDVHGPASVGGQRFDAALMCSQFQIFAHRELGLVAIYMRIDAINMHESVRIAERQRLDGQRVHRAEHKHRKADPGRQHQHGGQRECGRSKQCTHGEAEVSEHVSSLFLAKCNHRIDA